MLFADAIILRSEEKDSLKEDLDKWRDMLERRGLKTRRGKTEYMVCSFNKENFEELFLMGRQYQKTQSLKCLGSTIWENGEIEEEIRATIINTRFR